MIELINQQDLDNYKNRDDYPVAFADYLQARFNELKSCLEEYSDCNEKEFSLRDFGHLVVLQEADNLYDLKDVGLNPEEKGLFGSIPEVVDEIVMPDYSVYQISIVYNNSYMMIFYLEKGKFEVKYPELQEYLKNYPPEQIIFNQKGKHQPISKSKYLFNGSKFKTQGVDINVSMLVQNAIWDFVERRKQTKIPLDYLQIFNLSPATKEGKTVQAIECIQEQPAYKQLLYIPTSFTILEKIYLIDDVDHVTMLLAREY